MQEEKKKKKGVACGLAGFCVARLHERESEEKKEESFYSCRAQPLRSICGSASPCDSRLLGKTNVRHD